MNPSEVQIDFCTFGMFIIDEIDYGPDKPSVKNTIGGAGSYAALGARLFSPPPISASISWIVDRGSDFPPSIQSTIDQWQTSCLLRDTPERLTTRAINTYGPNEYRAFQYLTPKLRLDPTDLNPELLRSRSFHAVCSPSRMIDIVAKLNARRGNEGSAENLPRPIIVWEPVPDICSPDELNICLEAVKSVDVISPNHVELASFFNHSESESQLNSTHCDIAAIEKYTKAFLSSGIGPSQEGFMVVRCGKDGCYYASRQQAQWLPAYHQNSTKVIDPTGAGNAFLGGLAVALSRNQSIRDACLWGTVAASFAVEQVGMPTLKTSDTEKWNGEDVSQRLFDFGLRLS